MIEGREELERDARRRCQEGDFAGAAALAIRGYGPEILGFLSSLHRREEDADEAFSLWSEKLFRGLPSFGWGCSLRTWAYVIARNASYNLQRERKIAGRRAVPLSGAEGASRVAADVRTETRPYLRTEAKSKLAAIRDALPPEDRALLVLRLDKKLEWKDIARVMLGEEAAPAPTDAALSREAQRLRKRFQIVKDRLVEEGRRAGLLGGDEG
jgi:RNA polymerase sigma-70 factor (ECF subfamily)